jgi:septum formation protein
MTRLVLASASRARRHILAAAGLEVTVVPADLDERAIKTRAHRDGLAADRCAVLLAEAKAAHVAQRHPGVLAIGADQMLECDGAWLDKPRDPAEARTQLALLRGRTHTLHAAVAVAADGLVQWREVEPARLTMRDFSDAFLDRYVAAMGERLCETVGAYQLEGLGAQLFARIEGDYFAILGLPLLPLLGFLRERGAIAA